MRTPHKMTEGRFQSRRIMRLDVIDGDILPGEIADVLPAGNFFEHQQPDLVAGIEKVARLRIMRRAHDVAVEILAQNDGVATLNACRHGLSNPWKGLMSIQAAQLDDRAIEREALRREARLAETDASRFVVEQFGAA